MLTQEEKDFLQYWELHRDREARWMHQLLKGLPLGICFGVPVLLAFIFRDWYKWLPFISPEDLLFVGIAVLGIVLFYSLFRQKYLWDRKEQQYLELRARQARDARREAGREV
jgi:hypothetical protein